MMLLRAWREKVVQRSMAFGAKSSNILLEKSVDWPWLLLLYAISMMYYSFRVDLALRLSPYFIKNNGIGNNSNAMNPSREFPQPYPSLAYIFGPAIGRTAATIDRKTVLAAMAEAAYKVYTSIRYTFAGICVNC
jgi:hypothetical protein